MIFAEDAFAILHKRLTGKLPDTLLDRRIAELREKYKDQSCYFSKQWIKWQEEIAVKEAGGLNGR